MTNDLIKEIKKLINFGISDNEKLTTEERRDRMTSFRNELSIEKYKNLFDSLQDYFLNEEIPSNEKDEVVNSTIEFIRCYPPIEDNVEKLPITIITLYKSYLSLSRIMLLFEMIENEEYTAIVSFENIVLDYFSFISDPNNEFYIHNCYSKITKFNQRIFKYLETKDFDGIKHKDNINNPELIELLNRVLNNLEMSRKN